MQCPCGKAGFRSLRVARSVGRGVYPGARKVAVFWCPQHPAFWHFKHTA